VCIALGIALAACAKSSPTAPRTPSALALHLDTLAMREAQSPNVEWFNLLIEINAAVARGVEPAAVTIVVNGAPVTFEAVAVKWIDTVEGRSPVALDSAWTLIAWTGGENPRSILAIPSGDGIAVPPVRYLADTSARVVADSASFAAAAQRADGACVLTAVHYLGLPLARSCERVTTDWSFGIRVPPQRMTMSPRPVPGVRVFID